MCWLVASWNFVLELISRSPSYSIRSVDIVLLNHFFGGELLWPATDSYRHSLRLTARSLRYKLVDNRIHAEQCLCRHRMKERQWMINKIVCYRADRMVGNKVKKFASVHCRGTVPREHLNCIPLQLQRTKIVVKYNYLVLLLTVWGRNAALTSSCAFHYRDRIFLFANCNWDWINLTHFRCSWHADPGVSYEVAIIRTLFSGLSWETIPSRSYNQRQRNISIDYLINVIITSCSVLSRLPKNVNLCKININRVRRLDLLMSFVWLTKSLSGINTIIKLS